MVARGGVYYLEHAEWGRRPVVVLTRDAAIPVLKRVTVAAVTRRAREIPTEVRLDEEDGLPYPCVVSLDNLGDAWKALLVDEITVLGIRKMQELCHALAVATGC